VVTPGGTLSGKFGVAPVISSFTPSGGPAGTSVVITGRSFTGATDVVFGNFKATSFTVDSDTEITASAERGEGGQDCGNHAGRHRDQLGAFHDHVTRCGFNWVYIYRNSKFRRLHDCRSYFRKTVHELRPRTTQSRKAGQNGP
jgi:IPT/TIG domain